MQGPKGDKGDTGPQGPAGVGLQVLDSQGRDVGIVANASASGARVFRVINGELFVFDVDSCGFTSVASAVAFLYADSSCAGTPYYEVSFCNWANEVRADEGQVLRFARSSEAVVQRFYEAPVVFGPTEQEAVAACTGPGGTVTGDPEACSLVDGRPGFCVRCCQLRVDSQRAAPVHVLDGALLGTLPFRIEPR